MTIDAGQVLRLKQAIDSTLAGLGDRQLAGKALAEAYASFRSEAILIAEDGQLSDEFNRLFPAGPDARQVGASFGSDPFADESEANESRSLLHRLSGWLDGFKDLAQVEANAAAYAKARLRHETSS